MNLLRRFFDWVFFCFVKRRLNIEIKPNSRVLWLRLFGSKFGSLIVGSDSIVKCRIDFDGIGGRVLIGDRCFIGASHLVCRRQISIGNDVIISWGVTVVDHNSHSLYWKYRKHDVSDWIRGKKDWSFVDVRPVVISDKVWIGFGAKILKGVVIGEGAVVGAGSVVTRDIPAFAVVAGNPAQVIKQVDEIPNDVL